MIHGRSVRVVFVVSFTSKIFNIDQNTNGHMLVSLRRGDCKKKCYRKI